MNEMPDVSYMLADRREAARIGGGVQAGRVDRAAEANGGVVVACGAAARPRAL
ncbi:MAG: hypothetical protein JSR43_10725 [Proteobacteria bacterium]|nr:hypothetical protein [Pseudomonadota bacterium]